MLTKVANDLILDINEVFSVEKSARRSLLVYFKGREKPCTYLFFSNEDRDAAFEEIIKGNR